MNRGRSETLYQEACQYIPGGVNSPVRAFQSVGGTPVFMQKGEGCYLTDVDGNRFQIEDLDKLSDREYRMLEMFL